MDGPVSVNLQALPIRLSKTINARLVADEPALHAIGNLN
jgi:hypothetical protein